MSDTRERTVAEIIGWRFVYTHDMGTVPWGYWVNDRTGGMHGDDSPSGGPEIDCDDMLAWLQGRVDKVTIEMHYIASPGGWWLSVVAGSRVPEVYQQSTLHAALEAAVRAVAEVTDG